jgi:hypothetical protein
MTNVPAEWAIRTARTAADLLEGWASAVSSMLYSRRLIEPATVERIRLIPQGSSETISQGREDSGRRE